MISGFLLKPLISTKSKPLIVFIRGFLLLNKKIFTTGTQSASLHREKKNTD
ncbi:hypothetical protein GARC_4230 [Paraglaciecola arctica BSs20135]|uniref:Uncharacterized protein n=1 Tax=Paraglaciecola arctica BSs20135 TaxID=493475 RepID=K6YSM1_9ALTE|nr:hypothetical protein GARC_4230 [Paraglaciecola arctica BSs20135]